MEAAIKLLSGAWGLIWKFLTILFGLLGDLLSWIIDMWNKDPKLVGMIVACAAIATVVIFIAKQITGTVTGIVSKFPILFGIGAIGMIWILWIRK